jgi:hypothetical protein
MAKEKPIIQQIEDSIIAVRMALSAVSSKGRFVPLAISFHPVAVCAVTRSDVGVNAKQIHKKIYTGSYIICI